jgi:hypothetical protein
MHIHVYLMLIVLYTFTTRLCVCARFFKASISFIEIEKDFYSKLLVLQKSNLNFLKNQVKNGFNIYIKCISFMREYGDDQSKN